MQLRHARSYRGRHRCQAAWSKATDREITRIAVNERKRPLRTRPDRYPERTMWLFSRYVQTFF